jgi:hypothetical protein
LLNGEKSILTAKMRSAPSANIFALFATCFSSEEALSLERYFLETSSGFRPSPRFSATNRKVDASQINIHEFILTFAARPKKGTTTRRDKDTEYILTHTIKMFVQCRSFPEVESKRNLRKRHDENT